MAVAPPSGDYERWRRALADERLPAALLDLDALERNAQQLFGPARAANKTIRLASKSVRAIEVMKRIIELGAGTVRGLMAYAAAEAAFLVEQGFRDIVVAYPTHRASDFSDLARANEAGGDVALVIDAPDSLGRLDAAAARRGTKIPVLIEVDMAFRGVFGLVRLGVLRSPVATVADAVALAEAVGRHPHLELRGVMGYEAQIAGVTDKNPFSPLMNGPKRWMKENSRSQVAELRAELKETFVRRDLPLTVFNGGGTGSLSWAAGEPALTEITVGSGFMGSHLFDYYLDLALEPAALFALQVVRRPGPGVVTCHGGGYVASGEAGKDRLPVPFSPPGLRLTGLEGAGEVQTPVLLPPGLELALGDPIFFRHAKGGELAEHFSSYLIVRQDRVVARAPTYRGLGQCFL
jgi:D-serine deaminase-like pyridoxal phosphate-dependent protein